MRDKHGKGDTEKTILYIVLVCAILYFATTFPVMAPLKATFTSAIEIGGGLVAFLLLLAFLRYGTRSKHMMQRPAQQYSASRREREYDNRFYQDR